MNKIKNKLKKFVKMIIWKRLTTNQNLFDRIFSNPIIFIKTIIRHMKTWSRRYYTIKTKAAWKFSRKKISINFLNVICFITLI